MDEFEFSAYYGTFDQNMNPLIVTDVKDIVTQQMLSAQRITVKTGTRLNDYFGDVCLGTRKFLQISTDLRRYNIAEDHYEHDIVLDLAKQRKFIKLIYYAYINRQSNWSSIITGQLLQLKSYGLLDEVDLFVHVTDTTSKFRDVIDLITSIHPDATITTSSRNCYEFPGIRLVYDLAELNPEDVFIYMHTKGMSYNIQKRKSEEIAILKGTFENWRKNLEGFKDPTVMKLGLFPAVEGLKVKRALGARGGWVWFNFWYARGSYILQCDKPEIKGDRYYFEDWLGGLQDDLTISRNDCYNIYNRTGQRYFTGQEAHIELNFLIDEL